MPGTSGTFPHLCNSRDYISLKGKQIWTSQISTPNRSNSPDLITHLHLNEEHCPKVSVLQHIVHNIMWLQLYVIVFTYVSWKWIIYKQYTQMRLSPSPNEPTNHCTDENLLYVNWRWKCIKGACLPGAPLSHSVPLRSSCHLWAPPFWNQEHIQKWRIGILYATQLHKVAAHGVTKCHQPQCCNGHS